MLAAIGVPLLLVRNRDRAWGLTQTFSLVFAANSAVLITMSQVGGQLAGRVGPQLLLRRGLVGTFVASSTTPVVAGTHAGLAPLLISLFVLLGSDDRDLRRQRVRRQLLFAPRHPTILA